MFDFFKRPQCHFKSHNLTGSHNCTFLTVVVKCKVRFCFRLNFHFFFYDLWPIKDRINGKLIEKNGGKAKHDNILVHFANDLPWR